MARGKSWEVEKSRSGTSSREVRSASKSSKMAGSVAYATSMSCRYPAVRILAPPGGGGGGGPGPVLKRGGDVNKGERDPCRLGGGSVKQDSGVKSLQY